MSIIYRRGAWIMDGSGWVEGRERRDRGGRFAAGVSGNPAGKRKGTRNRMTMLKLALDADESGVIARLVVDRALAGDMVAAKFCLGLIMPKPRSRPVELDLPDCSGLDGIVAAFDVTVAAMAAGEITPDEALTVTKVLDRRRRALEARARQQEREAKRGRAAENSADETPTVVPPLAQVGVDLHPACTYGESATQGEAAATVDATEDAPRPPLPEFGSACIRPATRGRAPRHAGPIDPCAAAVDRLHFACIVGRKSGAHSAGDGEKR
jgi:hypothetical protein